MPCDTSQILCGVFRDRTVRAEDSAKSSSSLNTATGSHNSRSLQKQRDGCPSNCELFACQKLFITPNATLPVPLISYTVLTFENSQIPSHTSAYKHSKRKDISILCNEREHLEPHYVMDVQRKCTSSHCSHKVGI